jgi:hypothetical protein
VFVFIISLLMSARFMCGLLLAAWFSLLLPTAKIVPSKCKDRCSDSPPKHCALTMHASIPWFRLSFEQANQLAVDAAQVEWQHFPVVAVIRRMPDIPIRHTGVDMSGGIWVGEQGVGHIAHRLG